MKIYLSTLREREAAGLIRVQRHPTLPLLIWNYTEQCQFKKAWDEWTLQARGLVTDEEGNVVARPFRKFFNYEEHVGPLPAGTPEVIEKMDGSLGIVFWYGDQWHVATRGSFVSEQATHADALLRSDAKLGEMVRMLPTDATHLFEIIYGSNRIVVNYGDTDALVYLGSVVTATGAELDISDAVRDFCALPERLAVLDRIDGSELKKLEQPNKEGFVLRWPNGFRLKLKFEEYKRLHRIVTGTSSLTIWEIYRDRKPLADIIDRVPDEFHSWVDATWNRFWAAEHDIAAYVRVALERIRITRSPKDRREWAEVIKPMPLAELLFLGLDGRDLHAAIAKTLRPTYSRPFTQET